MAEQSAEDERTQRLSAQLRANLARRKAQKRARGGTDSAAPETPPGGPGTGTPEPPA